MRYREALNQALREEMEADEKVFIMGEDIGVFQGAFKVTAGLLEEFGEKRVRDTPISENTIVGMGVGAAMAGLRPDRGDHDHQLRAAGDGPDRELGGVDPLHVQRPGEGADGDPHAAGRGPPARPHALALVRGALPAHPRAARGGAHHGRGRQGAAEGGHPGRQPRDLHRARDPLRTARRGARERRPDALRRGGHTPRGRRRDDHRHLAHGAHRGEGGRRRWRRSTRSTPR